MSWKLFLLLYLLKNTERIGIISYLNVYFIFSNLFIYFYFWLHWVFVAAHGLSLVLASGGYSWLQCVGLSLWWLLLLQSTGSRRAGFGSCGMWTQ